MKDRAKKVGLLLVDGLTIIFLLIWNVSIIAVLGVALAPLLVWRLLFGTKKEIERYTKEGLKIEGQNNEEDKQ
tara:strand:- start:1157 stop:1375 length:219 start_codon:yes stop_codon:yes gene_type:complete